ncbi:hypothetical protein D3C74_343910 [compost metagenome]
MQQLPVKGFFLTHQLEPIVINHIEANRIPHPKAHMSMNILKQGINLNQSLCRPDNELFIDIIGIH